MAIRDENLYTIAKDHYSGYSAKTNEDRMISSVADGLKPVQRRILWSLWENKAKSGGKLIKAAKVVGHTLGNYHPHGDSSVYGAMQTMVSSMPTPLITGGGNWGSIYGDPAAAYRYTECSLSSYSQEVFFNPFYMVAMKKVNNFNDDSSVQEPVDLPARLPNYLVNGGMGIGVGIRGEFPSFTIPSLIKTIKRFLRSDEWDFTQLELCTRYGAVAVAPESAIQELVESGKAPVKFRSKYDINVNKRTATIRDSFPNINLRKAIDSALEKEKSWVRSIDDLSTPNDKFAVIVIEAKRSVSREEVEGKLSNLCEKYFSGNTHFDMFHTLRTLPKGADEVSIHLDTTNVRKVLETWLKFRSVIEKRAVQHHYRLLEEKNRKLKLTLLAAKNINALMETLALDGITYEEHNRRVASVLGVTSDEASFIMDLRLRQLRKIDADSTKKAIEDNNATMREYSSRYDDPYSAIYKDLEKLEAIL